MNEKAAQKTQRDPVPKKKRNSKPGRTRAIRYANKGTKAERKHVNTGDIYAERGATVEKMTKTSRRGTIHQKRRR